jgi:sugar lactone lactonase YvrE
VSVSPSATTTYTLTAKSADGTTATATATVTVLAAPAISSFTASSATITAGGSVTLSWTTTGATSLSIDSGVGTVTGSSVSVSPSATTTYTLTAKNAAGTAVSATVTVTVEAATAGPTISSFTAKNSLLTPVTTGIASTTLSWTTANATTLSIDNGVGTVAGASVTVTPAATTTYTLTAADASGATVTATATVYVRNQLAVLAGGIFSGAAWVEENPCVRPAAIASDSNGNIYIADEVNNGICKVTPAGVVTIIASDTSSFSSQEAAHAETQSAAALKGTKTLSRKHGMARTAQRHGALLAVSLSSLIDDANLNSPRGLVVSSDGKTIYVADTGNSAIRKIVIADDGTASISTLAGTIGTYGTSNGTGSAALFESPVGLALDGNGNLYVSDEQSNTIRRIVLSTSAVTTLAGTAGVYGSADGTGSEASFFSPEGLVMDSIGDLFVADSINDTIRRIVLSTASDGTVAATVSTLAGSASAMGSADGQGSNARFDSPYGLTLSSDGKTLYVSDFGDYTIRKLALTTGSGGAMTATVTTLAGTAGTEGQADGAGSAAWFSGPRGVALDASGDLFVADDGNEFTIRKINLSTNQVSSPVVNVFGSAGGTTDGAGSDALFAVPARLAADNSGNLYVTDSANNTIRKIAITTNSDGSISSTVSTLAGSAGLYGHADGTGSNARFSFPLGVAVDSTSNELYVSDWDNNTIRKIDLSSGAVTTLAGTAGVYGSTDGIGAAALFATPEGLALDSDGNLYVAEEDESAIRKIVLSTGTVSTLSITDGSGNSISPDGYGLATYTDSSTGKSYLYASSNCSILQIDLSTLVANTLAGSSTCGYADGTGAAASFDGVWDFATDSQGNVYASDLEDNLIRRITPAGVVTTIVGSYGNTATTTGALPATLGSAMGVAVDPSNNLYVTVPNAVLTLEP